MKHLLLLSVLLLLQAPAPTPRPAAGKSRKVSNTAKRPPVTQKAPAAEPPRIANPVPSPGKPEEINILSAPKITVTRDWYDTLLILVGIAGVVAAFITLRSIQKQTKSLQHSVTSMNRQTEIAEEKLTLATEPRLSCAGVRAVGLGRGELAVFFVKIRNYGPVDAVAVPLDIRVVLWNGSSVEYKGDQTVTVPANGAIEHFIVYGRVGSTDLLEEIGKKEHFLTVKGHIDRVPYCYRYNPSNSEVAELPMFIPCDFVTRPNLVLKAEPGSYETEDGSASFTLTEKEGSAPNHEGS